MSSPSPIPKAERLVDLVIALLGSRSYRSAKWIRTHVAGYDSSASTDAFSRKFERDKQELRDLGIPIETGPDGVGYRIRPGEFALPDLTFTAEEQVALAMAARLWENSTLREASTTALRKVKDAADVSDTGFAQLAAESAAMMHGRVTTIEPAFSIVLDAIRTRRSLQFHYRSAQAATAQLRSLAPWGLLTSRGIWYVVGFDHDRDSTRTFRLSRMTDTPVPWGKPGSVVIPEGIDLAATAHMGQDSATMSARVRIRKGMGMRLRRAATTITPDDDNAGWDIADIASYSAADLARIVCGYGPDVVVVEPNELREVVVDSLRRARAAQEGASHV